MQKRSYIFVFLIIIIALISAAQAAPVVAEDESSDYNPHDNRFDHFIQFDIGGRITIDREFGHACTTGAVKTQRIRGFGEMTRMERVRIAGNIIAVDEKTDWKTFDDAVSGLTVTTTIELCHRPMSTLAAVYTDGDNEFEAGSIIPTYDPRVISGDIEVIAATRQIWAASVSTNPGEEGSYHSNFIAAYGPGPYEEVFGAIDPRGEIFFYDEKYMWEYEQGIPYYDRDHRTRGYERGDYYVGNYFEIDQYAYTSGGEMTRFISMSSPFTETYYEEDMRIIGMAKIRESFEMHNLEGGPKAVTLAWYELF